MVSDWTLVVWSLRFLCMLALQSLIWSIHLRSLHFLLIFSTKENLNPSTSPLAPPPLPSPAFTLPSVSILSLWWLPWDAVPQLLPRDSSLFQGRQLITMTDKRPRQRRDHLSGRRRLNIPTVVLRAKSCESHVDGLFTIYIKKKIGAGKGGGGAGKNRAKRKNLTF